MGGLGGLLDNVCSVFFHYTLPQTDIARVTDTYEKRIDFSENSLFWASAETGNEVSLINRDVFFIQTVRVGGTTMVYRNEDTGWGWPPYFKFDTSNLQAEAADLKLTVEAPKWVALRHYGWRKEFLSIFPNAVGVWPVDGPDAPKPLPWVNIAVLVGFALAVFGVWRLWQRFRANRIDPVLDDIEAGFDAAEDAVAARRTGFQRWLDTWKPKHKRR